MYIKTILALIIFLVLSIFTIRKAVLGAINVKLTSVLLIFALVSSGVIYSSDIIYKISWLGMTIETAQEIINTEKNSALKQISNEIAKQKESFDTYTKKAIEEFNKRKQIVKNDLDQSAKYVHLMAEYNWRATREEYEDINNRLKNWENREGLKRDANPVDSAKDLEIYLDKLKLKKGKIPDEIKWLYFKRHRLYESLNNITQIENLFEDRLEAIDFTLPSPPKLPSRRWVNVTIHGGITIK